MLLTIGMAHCNDFDGAYFSIQDIRKELKYSGMESLLNDIEFLIVDNDPNPNNKHRKELIQFAGGMDSNVRVFWANGVQGTSTSRNAVIKHAKGEFVLVMDSHVLLCPVAATIAKLFQFIRFNRDADDIFSGPLVYDNLNAESTHFNDAWGSQMWGQWRTSWDCTCNEFRFSIENGAGDICEMRDVITQKPHSECPKCGNKLGNISYYGHESILAKGGYDLSGNEDAPFEIFSQGLGMFLVRRESWLGFNPHTVGFGGEEGYIHEKYRKAGRKAICLPFLRWLHRFHRPDGVTYPLTVFNKVRNYVLEFMEIGKPLDEIRHHFVVDNGFPAEEWDSIYREAVQIYGVAPMAVADNSGLPFITCICPTYKRPEHLAAAIKCFEEQDYPKDRCELIVLDDAGQIAECSGESWKLVSTEERVPNLWQKFNIIADMGNSDKDIICIWEDDDIYLPWHLSSIAKARVAGEKQFFAPEFAYSNYGQNIGDVVKENATGRFHATWAYSKELWDDVGGYETVLNITGDKVMREKCLRSSGGYTRYETDNPTYVYRWARAAWHASAILAVDSEAKFQEKWDYLGFRPIEKVDNLVVAFDEESALLYAKFASNSCIK
jgi:glycosyltransferase involved in cell wall biosynthesis